ncbi:MAG: hypothetical protein ACPLKX_01730 [Dictyoglomaceae bacterium]
MRRFKIFLVLIFIIFLSGCARTVTSPLKKVVEVSFKLSKSITFDDENYYLVIAFNSLSQPKEDLTSWKNFILFRREMVFDRFYKGKNGNLKQLSPTYFECSVDFQNNFNLKIPLYELYEDGKEPEILHVNIFYFYINSETEKITFHNYLFQDISIEIRRGNQTLYSMPGFIDNLILKFY